jgi:hypothetical protein
MRGKSEWSDFIKVGGDGLQYIESAENLLSGGDHAYFRTDKNYLKSNYINDGDFDKGIYFAFRTPGYAFVYLPMRSFLDKENALFGMLMLQLLMNTFSKFLICLLVLKFSKRSLIATGIALFSVNFVFFFATYNDVFLTEPIAFFFLIFSFYLLEVFKGNWSILLAGICLVEAVLLRPFLLPFFGLYCLMVFLYSKEKKVSIFFGKKCLLFIISMIIFLFGWGIRNYNKTNEIILLSKTLGWQNYTNKGFKEIINFSHNIGANHEWWVSKHLPHWYINEASKLDLKTFSRIASLPDSLQEKILDSKSYYFHSIDSTKYSLLERKCFEDSAGYSLGEVNNYVLSSHGEYKPLIFFETMFCYSTTPAVTPFIDLKYPFNVVSVYFECFLNRFIVMIGLIGGIFLLFKKRESFVLKFIILTVFCLIGLFSFLGINESREIYISSFLGVIPFSLFLGHLIVKKRYLLIFGLSLLVGMVTLIDLPKYIHF